MEPIIPSETSKKSRDMFLPVSIIVAAVLVSGAVVYSATKKSSDPASSEKNPPVAVQQPGPDSMRPVSAEDHITGSLDAPVIVVEYSDLECPFCKRFHETMLQTVKSYEGKVAWVFRHFPLTQLHSKALKEAEATECAAELGGNEGFWKYTNRLMELTPANNGFDLAKLPDIAVEIGLDKAAFTSCLESGRHVEKITAHADDAVAAGAQGTPYSVVVAKSGKKAVIPGALPFTGTNPGEPTVKSIIDELLK